MPKQDKNKTKAELLQEIEKLRKRIAKLQAEGAGQAAPDANGNGNGNGHHQSLPDEAFEDVALADIADAVTGALKDVVPARVDVKLTAEERVGLVLPEPDVAHQVIVNLYVARGAAASSN